MRVVVRPAHDRHMKKHLARIIVLVSALTLPLAVADAADALTSRKAGGQQQDY